MLHDRHTHMHALNICESERATMANIVHKANTVYRPNEKQKARWKRNVHKFFFRCRQLSSSAFVLLRLVACFAFTLAFFLSFLLSNHFPTICSIHLILNIYFSSQKANRINRERTKTKSKSSIAHGSKQREREELVKSLCENYRLRKLTNKYTNSCGGGGNKTTKKVEEENRGKYII